MPPNADVVVSATPEEAAARCAGFLWERLSAVLGAQEFASFAISGGSSPKAMFRQLAVMPLDWRRVHLFWVDERCVPADDPASNYRMARECLIDVAKIPESQVHRVRTELPPKDAAGAYSDEVAAVCGGRFDVMHRGIGPDAHTASLFPGEPLIESGSGIAGAVWVEKFSQWRVTLLPEALRAARSTAVFTPGADKAGAIEQILNGSYQPGRLPAQITVRNGTPETWFLDAGSASKLSGLIPGSSPAATNRT